MKTSQLLTKITKRNGICDEFHAAKITKAIQKAGEASGEFSYEVAEKLSMRVLNLAQQMFEENPPTVEQIQDIVEEVHRIFRNLCINRMETIYLRMPLKDRFTAKYTIDFEKFGFFFCGILPRSEGNDELILQYLNNYVIDYNLLKITSDKGLEILEYIKKQTTDNP